MNNLEKLEKFKSLPLEAKLDKSSKYLTENPGKVPIILCNRLNDVQFPRIKYLIPKLFQL